MTLQARQKLIRECDRLWSAIILSRDKRTCQYCHRPGNNPHHIFSRRYHAVRWSLSNGITLCWAHHNHFSHGDPERFRDWIIQKVGQETYDELKVCAYTVGQKIDLAMVKLGLRQIFHHDGFEAKKTLTGVSR